MEEMARGVLIFFLINGDFDDYMAMTEPIWQAFLTKGRREVLPDIE